MSSRMGFNMRNRIKDLRIDTDYTQEKLAAMLDITQRKYSYIETGQQYATYEILIKLAKFYGTSVDYLLGLTDNPVPYNY